jgi:hypothetical protein
MSTTPCSTTLHRAGGNAMVKLASWRASDVHDPVMRATMT